MKTPILLKAHSRHSILASLLLGVLATLPGVGQTICETNLYPHVVCCEPHKAGPFRSQ